MDNNTTLDFLNFNNPSTDPNFGTEFSDTPRSFPNPQGTNFNSPGNENKKSGSYLDSIQSYFNIDTNMFINRLYYSIVPFKKSNFILDVIENNPDIYGPLWILLTLVLCIGVTNSLVHFFNTYGEHSTEVDFGMVTAVFTLLSLYITLVPLGLYFYMSYNRASTNYTYMEILCTYGYNLTILVPISIFYHFNFSILRISLIVISVVITFAVLYNTFWPGFRNLEKRNEAVMIMILILILQLVVISLLKVYYLDGLSPIEMSHDTSPAIFPHTQGSSMIRGSNINESEIMVKEVKTTIIEVTKTPKIINTTMKAITETVAKIIDNKVTTHPKEDDVKRMVDTTISSIVNRSIVTEVSKLISNATRN